MLQRGHWALRDHHSKSSGATEEEGRGGGLRWSGTSGALKQIRWGTWTIQRAVRHLEKSEQAERQIRCWLKGRMSCCVDSGPKTVQLEAVRLVGKMLPEVAVAGAARWRAWEMWVQQKHEKSGIGQSGWGRRRLDDLLKCSEGQHCLAYTSNRTSLHLKQPENRF